MSRTRYELGASVPATGRWRAVPFAACLAASAFAPRALEAAPARFVRGDADASGALGLTDAIGVLRQLFGGEGGPLRCLDAADADDSGRLEITDAIAVLAHLFLGGPPPPAPYPDCGLDPTGDDLDCEDFAPCAEAREPPGLDLRPPNRSCVAFPRPREATGAALQRVFPALSLIGILDMRHSPGDPSAWYAVRKPGYVYRFENRDGVTAKSTVVTLTDRVASTDEGGLLGMAFHPRFASNGHAFLYYTAAGSPLVVRVSRFTSPDGGATLDPASERILLSIDQPTLYHHGGAILFGPDGYLYAGVGDGGREATAQDTGALPGSVLRIDVDRGSPYAIPPGNPFASGGGRPEIYAWGLRNPWRLAFDPVTGELWAGDVGKDGWEEVDRIENGKNYGWPIREGAHCYGAASCSAAGLVDPVVEYPQSEGNCVIGGCVYRGAAIPGLQGAYVYGDWGNGRIWAATADASGRASSRLLVESGLRILSFAQGEDGEVFVLSGDKVHKLVPAPGGGGGAPDESFPQRLSETGLFDPADTRRPGPCLIPYGVNAPLWSDGAEKERWLAVPDGAAIRVLPDGDWDLPVGSILVKSFNLAGRLVETRLLMRHDDGEWAGYSFEWDDAESDAVLLAGEKTKAIGGGTWTFPSRSQCLQCHTAAARRTLGLETAQLNGPFTYPQTGRTANQLATLEHIGLFEAPLGAPPSEMPALADPSDASEPLELRARSYLHSNCSNCHRPDGGGRGAADLRFATPSRNVCDALPLAGDLGVAGARLLAPGDPARSLISLRIRATGAAKMPPLGRAVVDDAGAGLVDAWIAAHPPCEAPPAGEVILDDGGTGTSSFGDWRPSNGPNPYGTGSLFAKSAGAWYRFHAELPAPGTYEVQLWWTEYSSRLAAVPIEVTHAAGTAELAVDQRRDGGRWNALGAFAFDGRAAVTVRSPGGGSACADAVRIVPAAP
ncbi:MAG: PQQ-dependent sugar dehydrogenase [Planctomycetes bacterium]|nr:PQQ-dependent sugar dehydrogenase [Planctomycetota bacterium]